jgi:hypothetical protein
MTCGELMGESFFVGDCGRAEDIGRHDITSTSCGSVR